MATDPADAIDTLRERIRESDHISDRDRDLLLEFSDEMRFLGSKYSDHRHLKLLQHCTVLAGSSQKYDPEDLPDVELANALKDEDAAKNLVSWIHANIDNEESNRDYRVAIRMFGGHVTEGDSEEKPPSIDQISATTSRNYDPMPDPAKMLYWEDHIQPMLDDATNARDKAAIAVSWDLGARSGEFRSIRIGDIVDHKHGVKVTVDGKTGQRSPLLIPSVPYLRRWLDVHPAGDDPTAPLWSKLNSAENPSYEQKMKMIKKPARRAGITHTNITFTRMRKSSASYLASQNVNQAHLEDHHGWKRGSDTAARYISVFGDANDREIARAHGVDVEEDETDPTAPLACPRCGRETPRELPACMWCGQVLSQEAATDIEDQSSDAMESIRKANPEVAEAITTIEQFLGQDAGLRAAGARDE